MGIGLGAKCFLYESSKTSCRVINYIGSVSDTISDNAILVSASCLGLATLFFYSKMKSLANKELQAEECIRKDLVDRYQKIATRITDHKGEEIREYAEAILSRKFNINQEIDSLKLPSLAWKDIIGITKPVFDAAQEVLDRQVEAL